jgi:hypothetical protein
LLCYRLSALSPEPVRWIILLLASCHILKKIRRLITNKLDCTAGGRDWPRANPLSTL